MGRVDKFTKNVTVMQEDMKKRDEALKKVPSNCAIIMKQLKA